MYSGRTLFSQVMDFVPGTSFDRIVVKYGGDIGVRTLRCIEHFRAMGLSRSPIRRACAISKRALDRSPQNGTALGQHDLADPFASRIEDHHPVERVRFKVMRRFASRQRVGKWQGRHSASGCYWQFLRRPLKFACRFATVVANSEGNLKEAAVIGTSRIAKVRTVSASLWIAPPSSPAPQPHHRLPSTSTRKPSGSAVMKVRPLASFCPLSTTSYTRRLRGRAPYSTM
jgi:hypothetical protein